MIQSIRIRLRKSSLARWLALPLASSYGRMWDLAALSKSNARWWMGGSKSDADFEASGRHDAEALARFVLPGSRVLDLGCGVGRVMTYLAPHCAELYGVDVSSRMLSHARDRLRSIPNVHLLRSRGRDLRPLPDGHFDFAFAFQVFQHLEREDVMRYMAELHRVLRPGRVYLHFLNLDVDELAREFYDYALASELLQIARRRFFTEAEVRVYASLAGFDATYLWTEGNGLFLLAGKPEEAPDLRLVETGAHA